METRRLHNGELKRLAAVLRDHPFSGAVSADNYHKATKKAIKHLPSRLQSSLLSRSTPLCHTHAGLNHHLLTELWSWVRAEFRAIGRFIYPLMLDGKLTSQQELAIRQLEPVMEMWRKDFVFHLAPPPDREPISHGDKWLYQEDQCSACMLTRMGSDEHVLRALYAGMIGRYPLGKLTSSSTAKAVLAELGVSAFDDPKSKRVRFVRYWIKSSAGGEALLFEAVDLGRELKVLKREWREGQKASMYPEAQPQDPFQDPAPAGLGINQDASPFRDPRPAPAPPLASFRPQISTDPQHHFKPHSSLTTVPPLRINKREPDQHYSPPRPASIASTSTCQSYDNGPPAWKFHQAGPSQRAQHAVPAPHRMSMYYGYDDVQQVDPFEDDEGGEEEVEWDEEEPRTPRALTKPRMPTTPRALAPQQVAQGHRETRWGDLY